MADERLRIKVEADAARAEQDLKTIAELGDELTDDDLTILVDAKTDAAEAQVKSLTKLLATAEDPVDIKVITSGIAQARQQIDDLGKAGQGTRRNVDDLNKSADSSKSVFANMVGNATQDLGALGGLAGSAGVAIGQMGEYMADARAQGDSFGTILKNFGAVAGPIALISVGVGLVTGAMNEMNKRAEESKKRTKEFGDAMKGAADDAVGFADVIQNNVDALEDFRVLGEDVTGTFGTFVDEMGSKIPLVGKFFKEASVDIFDASRRAGISVFDLSQEIENGADVSDDFARRLQHAKDAGLITAKEMEHVADAVGDYGKEAANAARQTNLFSVNQESSNAILQETIAQSAPLEQYTELWNRLFADMADGTIDTNSAANAINLLADKLGLTQEEVINLAQADLAKQMEDTATATNRAGEEASTLADALRDEADAHLEAAEAAKEHLGLFKTYADAVLDRVDAEADLKKVMEDEKKTLTDQRDAIIKVAEARVEEKRLAREASGEIVSQTDQVDEMNWQLLNLAGTLNGPTQDAMGNYIANLNGIPESKASEIIALVDEGKIDEAAAMLAEVSTSRDVALVAEAETKDAEKDLLDVSSAEYVAYMELGAITDPAERKVDDFEGATERRDPKVPVGADDASGRTTVSDFVSDIDASAAAVTVNTRDAELDEALRKVALLERTVYVNIAASGLERFTTNVTNAINSALGGGRTTQSQAARYVWRNGRYVEVD